MKILKNILFYMAVAILILTIGFAAFSGLFGIRILAVATGSMEPDIPVGSVVITVPAVINDINIGNDVAYLISGASGNQKAVVHRVKDIDIKENRIITQGIANNMPDAPVPFSRVIGRVVYKLPFIGFCIYRLSTFKGKLAAGVIFATFMLLFWGLKWIYKNRRGGDDY